GRGIFNAGDGFADRNACDSSDRHNVAQLRLRNVDALQPAEAEQLGNARLFERTIELGNVNLVAGAENPVVDAGDGQPAQIIRVVEVRHLHLQRRARIARVRGNGLKNLLE